MLQGDAGGWVLACPGVLCWCAVLGPGGRGQRLWASLKQRQGGTEKEIPRGTY